MDRGGGGPGMSLEEKQRTGARTSQLSAACDDSVGSGDVRDGSTEGGMEPGWSLVAVLDPV